MKMTKNSWIMIVCCALIAILFVILIIQTVVINNLKKDIKDIEDKNNLTQSVLVLDL